MTYEREQEARVNSIRDKHQNPLKIDCLYMNTIDDHNDIIFLLSYIDELENKIERLTPWD